MFRLQNQLAHAHGGGNITHPLLPHQSAGILSVVWQAPFFSGGGYCSESELFALGLDDRRFRDADDADFDEKLLRVSIVNFGDKFDAAHMNNLPTTKHLERLLLLGLEPRNLSDSIVVCHSEPGAWRPGGDETTLCPTVDARFRIGRTMTESDRVPSVWMERLALMDALWVPTQFHRTVFCAAANNESSPYHNGFGPNCEKVAVIPEAVDTEFFDPDRRGVGLYTLPHLEDCTKSECDQYVFLSIFKFEPRKGWRFLIESFVREFTSNDRVILYILTSAYNAHLQRTPRSIEADIARHVKSLKLKTPPSSLPRIKLLPSGIPAADMPGLYRAVDAFVLPTRGEGWGRPIVEAMSMGLPVLATNWSGPTEYLTPDNSYPIKVKRLEVIPEPKETPLPPVAPGAEPRDSFGHIIPPPPKPVNVFAGSQWARPSVSHLRQLMRHVYTNRAEANMKGATARQDMIQYFSKSVVAERVATELYRIDKLINTQTNP